MIDSIALVWGGRETDSRRVEHRPQRNAWSDGTTAVPISTRKHSASSPVALRFGDVYARMTAAEHDGTVREYHSGAGAVPKGSWDVAGVTVMYEPGRLELRASLPKVVAERNDVVLDERGVHDALHETVRIGSEAIGVRLDLRDAVLARADYCFQWQVPSVAFVLEHLRSSFSPARKIRTENVSPTFEGRSLVYGYRSNRVLRFYDKGAEAAEQAYKRGELEPLGLDPATLEGMDDGLRRRAMAKARERAKEQAMRKGEACGYELDRILRFEVQERRRQRLRLVHESGYLAGDVRRELAGAVTAIGGVAIRDVRALIESYGDWAYAVPFALCALHLVEHPELFPLVRECTSRPTYMRWRRRARQAASALRVADWQPEIPDDAFAAQSSVWDTPLLAVS